MGAARSKTAPAGVGKPGKVVVRFAGDSGDGVQLAGHRFTTATAAFGNDLATLPSFPAEIRAPQGTLPGVSTFQIQFADHDVLTPGDFPDVLVAMNPAALKANLGDVPAGGTLIVNTDAFTRSNLAKAGYDRDPLADGSLDAYQLHGVPMSTITQAALAPSGLGRKRAERAKNMFVLGLLCWIYQHPADRAERSVRTRFSSDPQLAESNVLAFRAGWNYGETTESFALTCEIAPAERAAGEYRQVTGNTALACGIVAAGQCAGLQILLGSYPITPASDVLHQLAGYKNFGVMTLQTEDEIAAVGAALGASFGGALGVTVTSGPGFALKSETIGLAVMTELPLVVIDVQRCGPSTGLPTKTEQADLLQAMFGRNGESPVPVIAPRSPADCFDVAIEATRIALKYRTPVLLLSDGLIANGSEPWRIPEVDTLPDLAPGFATDPRGFQPYARDAETLARPWAVPGTPRLEHRIGGLEKADGDGAVSYDPANHDRMVRLRRRKVDGVDVPDVVANDPSGQAEVVVVGWGSTYGPIGAAVRELRQDGRPVAHVHLRHLNPLPQNLGAVLRGYRRILVPELNLGQLALLLRARYLVDAVPFTKVQGVPFTTEELRDALAELTEGVSS